MTGGLESERTAFVLKAVVSSSFDESVSLELCDTKRAGSMSSASVIDSVWLSSRELSVEFSLWLSSKLL